MIDRDHKLPLARQAKAVGISRGSIYYRPRPVGEAGLGLMRRIDELHLEYPFAGSRMMRGLLRQEGLSCGRRHIATLMRRMGIEALYRKPNTSRRRPGHTVYPYLLRGLEVSRPNQVWAMDITYLPMARGFVYLAAVMDWHSRKVLAWRVSVTMDTDFCVEALEESLGRHGAPEIFNTDQGSQFTSDAFTGLLKANGIQISMDGKGSWKDDVFVERLWKSVKYEEVYLRAYESVPEARTCQLPPTALISLHLEKQGLQTTWKGSKRIIQTEPHAASRAPCSGQPRYDHDPLTDTCSYPGLKRSLPIRSSISSNISLVTITSASWNTSLLA